MGSLGGIQAGLRQLRRERPLETCVVDLGDGLTVVAPTVAETLRVKAIWWCNAGLFEISWTWWR